MHELKAVPSDALGGVARAYEAALAQAAAQVSRSAWLLPDVSTSLIRMHARTCVTALLACWPQTAAAEGAVRALDRQLQELQAALLEQQQAHADEVREGCPSSLPRAAATALRWLLRCVVHALPSRSQVSDLSLQLEGLAGQHGSLAATARQRDADVEALADCLAELQRVYKVGRASGARAAHRHMVSAACNACSRVAAFRCPPLARRPRRS